MPQFQYVVRGIVQGVAFRYYTKKRAETLGISGYVKNLSNGDVEIAASGDPENIKLFEDFLQKGPTSATVSGVEKRECDFDIKGSAFEILF